MQLVFGILLMFTGAASGLPDFQDPVVCKFAENDQCYVPVGQRLHLPMPRKGKFNVKLTDTTSNIRFIFKSKIKPNHPQTPTLARWRFVNANKTLILTSAERSDSGTYTLEIFNKGGTFQSESTMQVNVEAAVSSETLSDSCLFLKLRKVYCSADGDHIRFSWTSALVTRLENKKKTIVLDKDQNGKIVCRVENHISREDNSIELQRCPDVTLPVLISVCVLLILLSVLAFYIYKKRQGLKNKGAPSQDDKKVVYGDITHFPNNRTETKPRTSPDQAVDYGEVVHHKQKKNEDEVQYGELVFNTPAQKKNKVPKVQEECVYADVQHGQ